MFSGKPSLGSNPQVNYEISAGLTNSLNDFFFGLGGDEPAVHTELELKDVDSHSVQVDNIQVLADCQSPLNGTLVKVTGMPAGGSAPSGIRLDYQLSRNSSYADSPYFTARSIPIKPGATQHFNIRIVASNAACNFWYKITILSGSTKQYETVADDGSPFRISSFSPAYVQGQDESGGRDYVGYGQIYLGGTDSPASNGALTLVTPAPTHGKPSARPR
jgi:hypothetical protein